MDTYLKSPTFPSSNCEYYNSLSSFWISECIPRIFCIWEPNDRTVKVDTYLKSPEIPALNGKHYIFLSWFWIFGCIYRIFWIWYPNDHTVKLDVYLKSPIFLHWMVSATSLSAHLNMRLHTQNLGCKSNPETTWTWMVETYLKGYELSASNAICCSSLLECRNFWRNKIDTWVDTVNKIFSMYKKILPKLHWNSHSFVYLVHSLVITPKILQKFSNPVQHNDGCHCLGTCLACYALRLIWVLVPLARVDQDSAWIRQSYPQKCKNTLWNLKGGVQEVIMIMKGRVV